MKLPAVAREALIGFPKNHTLKLDSEMVRKTVVDAEGRSLCAISSSFHTTTFALVMGSILLRMGFLDRVQGPDGQLTNLINEWKGTQYPTRMREPESEVTVDVKQD